MQVSLKNSFILDRKTVSTSRSKVIFQNLDFPTEKLTLKGISANLTKWFPIPVIGVFTRLLCNLISNSE